jgi:hypothetical protein
VTPRPVLAGPASGAAAEQVRNDAQDPRWKVKKESMMILTIRKSWEGENLDLIATVRHSADKA